ncbi:hypothetical protein NHQ30_001768 [Ciborinia camelliae]|nr:hypothetical protein NHQ30_001768 [Ciborinia camelliae]
MADQDPMIIEQSATQLTTRDAASNVAKSPTENNKTHAHMSLPFEILLSILERAILSESRTLRLISGNCKDNPYFPSPMTVTDSPAPFRLCRELRKRLLASKILKPNTLDFGTLEFQPSVLPSEWFRVRLVGNPQPRFYFNPNIDTLRLDPQLYTSIFSAAVLSPFSTLVCPYPAMLRNVKRLVLCSTSCDSAESLLEIHKNFPSLEHHTVRFEAHGHQEYKDLPIRLCALIFKYHMSTSAHFVLLGEQNVDGMPTQAIELYYAKSVDRWQIDLIVHLEKVFVEASNQYSTNQPHQLNNIINKTLRFFCLPQIKI